MGTAHDYMLQPGSPQTNALNYHLQCWRSSINVICLKYYRNTITLAFNPARHEDVSPALLVRAMEMSKLASRLLPRIRTLLLAVLASSSLPVQAAPLQLQINGSNTIGARLAPQLVEGMLRETGASDIQVQLNQETREHRITAISSGGDAIEVLLHAHGSGTAFSGLVEGTAQIGAASRPIRPNEAEALAQAGDMLSAEAEQVIGLDGLAVIVHPDNPVTALDLEQVAQVFAGKITDWRELGGRAGPIKLYARDSQSGTWETFRDLVLAPRQLELDADARRFASTSALSRSVSSDVQGIGFVGLADIAPARAIALGGLKN